MAFLAAASGTLNPLGPVGAAILAGSLVVLLAYLVGARERSHWGGRPPTAQEYMSKGRSMTKVQYSTSQWSQRVLWIATTTAVLGAAMLAYGALA